MKRLRCISLAMLFCFITFNSNMIYSSKEEFKLYFILSFKQDLIILANKKKNLFQFE